MAIAANTIKFPPKATADMAIKQVAVITAIVWCLLSRKALKSLTVTFMTSASATFS